MALAEWITAGEPTMDLSSADIRRFAPHHNNKRYLQECVKETLSWHYLLRFPYSERIRARRLRCSPLFSELDAAGASWGDKMGWEVAKWFSLPGEGKLSSLWSAVNLCLSLCDQRINHEEKHRLFGLDSTLYVLFCVFTCQL